MKHYSVMATDLYINEVHNDNGWRLGEPLHYEVNNCEWNSLVKVFFPAHRTNRNELIIQPYYQSGDREKMLNDIQSLNLALQTHLGAQYALIMKEII